MIGKENRTHIAIFGRRNNGKSSFINAITGQDIAIVSDVPGTTTDPVKKSIEIKGIGPVVLIDTAGTDDLGELGIRRVQKSLSVIDQIDVAVLIITDNQFEMPEKILVDEFKERNIPYLLLYNKTDIYPPTEEFLANLFEKTGKKPLLFSCLSPDIQLFTSEISSILNPKEQTDKDLFKGIVKHRDLVLLVTPIDSAAPEGRIILPQVQAIRNILDHNAINIVCKETELETVLKEYKIRPSIIVTDSQVFNYVNKIVPADIPLTSFSIVLAKLKGNFDKYIEGTPYIDKLKDGDKVLILESCTHHATCEDIGRVKIPALLQKHTGKTLYFKFIAGLDDLPDNISDYAMVIQCGGCVVTKKQLENRLRKAINANIPVSNYGLTLAYITGIYDRAIKTMNHGK